MSDLQFDLTQENEAAQDNALLNLIAAAVHTPGWVMFSFHNGETVDLIAGALTPEMVVKIHTALIEAQPVQPLQNPPPADNATAADGPSPDDDPPVYDAAKLIW